MAKYKRKSFSPHIYQDWIHLFRQCSQEQRAELLLAITDYPNYEPSADVPIWDFIKSQLEAQYQSMENKSQQMSTNRTKEKQKSTEVDRSQPLSTEVNKSTQIEIETRIETGIETKENEISISKKKFTSQSKFYVNGQDFDEFPVEALPLLKKHWSDDELESIRKDLACKPYHETSVEQLLVQYPPLQKQAEEHFERFWSSYTPVKTTDGRVVSKGSRKEAEAKYMKIVKSGVNPDDILNGLRAYINDCQHNNRLTCGATVFLNQERWKDDYKPITAIAQQPMPQMPRMSLKEMKEMQNDLEIQKILRGER